MYEFEMKHKDTNEVMFLHGYSMSNAWERVHKRGCNLNEDDWYCVMREYVD